MNNITKSLLVTSINPHRRLSFQIQCFNRWKALGFDVRSVNVREEAELLLAKGMASEDINVITIEDSGAALFGKAVPRIMPLLEWLLKEPDFDSFMISNSDIFPATRSSSIISFWERCNTSVALTREECHATAAYAFTDQSPYRGGLDVFFMTKAAMARVVEELSRLQASARMAFGIPGWDYLLGACMLSPKVRGSILDSATLLHVSHRASYGNMDEFSHYVADMSRLGAVSSRCASEAADEFARRIKTECERNHAVSWMAKLIYYSPAYRRPGLGGEESSADADHWRWILQKLIKIAPQFASQYRAEALRSLAYRFFSEKKAHLAMGLSFMLTSHSILFRFTQALFAISFALRCKSGGAAIDVTESYPTGNQHDAALRNILKAYPEADPNRRLALATLFGTELVDYGIFNPRLYNYLALCCENGTERALLADIECLIRRKKQDAIA